MTPAEFIDNPAWADFIPERRDSGARRHLPAHEDCARLDPNVIAMHLRAGGTLGKMAGYEERSGQIDMLEAIVRAYNDARHLMIEAGTGVGKSLAYLIPSVIWASVNDTPVVISTATRNLQSQLISSDIPRALAVLGDNADKFKVALLKGRNNYLCLRAVSEFFASGFWTMSANEQAEMPAFIAWLQTTKEGDLDEYDGLPRNLLACPGEECSGRKCPYYSRCFVYTARKRAAEAHLVIANHALVLAEATSTGGTILPAYSYLVLDEAHNLESIATDYLSYEFSMPMLTRILNRLIRNGRGKKARSGGALASIERQLLKGLLANSESAAKIRSLINEITLQTLRVVNAVEVTLQVAEKIVFKDRNKDVVRYRETLNVLNEQSRMDSEILKMTKLLHNLRDALDESTPEGEFNYFADLSSQMNAIADSFTAFANEANFVISANKDTHAYWGEVVHIEKRRGYVKFVAAPLSVAAALKAHLYNLKDSVILSSATLRVGNDFRYMAKRLGCEEKFDALTADSPFDYFKQCYVSAIDYIKDPGDAAYVTGLAKLIVEKCANGHALVLFTSYEMMRQTADLSVTQLAERDVRVLVQGEGLSRERMTRVLKENPDHTVIFGSQSFWEGVDVAGDALNLVIITRLPFAQVGDPIVEARSEKIDREGGNSFRDYMIPEAVIRFRQGFGRLIRTKRDTGTVIITDSRIVTKNYGAIFRKSIPATVHSTRESATKEVKNE